MSVRRMLAHGTSVLALPYGYTVTIWVAGGLAREHYQRLSWGDAAAFLAGALGAFGLLVGSCRSEMPGEIPGRLPGIVAWNGWAALAAAASAGVCMGIPVSGLGYFVTGFTATLVYILGVGLLAWLGREGASDAKTPHRR